MKKKLTVTVGIPAYNEEKGLISVVRDVLSQKETYYTLKEINIYSDGSTDNTNKEALKSKKLSNKIHLYLDKVRRGKYFRLNQMFKSCKSDILITLDADLTLSNNDFIDSLVTVIINDHKALMVAAHPVALKSKTLEASFAYSAFLLWDYVRLSVPKQDHVQNFYACAMAFNGNFARKIQIPEGLNEMRLYLYALAKKYKGFRYCLDAKLYYWPPTTLSDYFKLANRTFGTRNLMLEKIFGENITAEYKVPRKYVVIGILKAFIHKPIETVMGLFLSLFLERLRPKRKINNSPLWEITKSSKKKYA